MITFSLGMQLKELRSTKQWTQAQVAEKLGITRGAYSHFENNRNEPDQKTLIALADLYHVSVDYLLGRSSSKFPNSTKQFDIQAHIGDEITDADMLEILNFIEQIKQKK